ncbi:MAG TPA: hypothetical protein VK272_09095 [Solirubrobacteraceae bacterium]|nr:hypothetical protein [Solirubrobacteraceae bacterium]
MPRTPGAPEHVVSPTLLDSIDKYVEQLDAGTAISGDVVPETSPVISFMENAFAQFFENETHSEITGFDSKAKKKASRLRRTKKAGLSAEARAIIALFEQYCDIHEDVLGAGYGGQASVLEEFHFKYVVRLLERISALAKKKSDDELQEHTERSLVAFLAAIEAYDWNSDESDG